jgi:uncharacterized membrane protein YozB (DUF420 family)
MGDADMAAFPKHPADRRFYSGVAVVAAAVIVTGFASTYGPKVISGSVAVPAIIHLHAALFSLWLLLFVAQTLLVMRGRILAHRRVGYAGLALAGLMLATGLAAAVDAARAGHLGIPGVSFPTRDGFFLLNVASICVFSALVGAGWWWRRHPQAHNRLMLSATVAGLMPPGIARLPGVAGHEGAIAGLTVAFLLVGPAYDLVTRRRVHPAYAGLLLATLIVPPVVLQLSSAAAWHALVRWATG